MIKEHVLVEIKLLLKTILHVHVYAHTSLKCDHSLEGKHGCSNRRTLLIEKFDFHFISVLKVGPESRVTL